MSADLLRRAAARLREHAEAAPRSPWTVQYFGDRGYPQRVSNDRAELVANTYDGPPSPAGSAEYIALMHPLVALALADLLDYSARWFEAAEKDGYEYDEGEALPIIALARAVLREPEDGAR